jgi:HEAT repeat protein
MYRLLSTGDAIDEQLYSAIIPLLIDHLAARRDTSHLESALSHDDPFTRIRALLALRTINRNASVPENVCDDMYGLLSTGDAIGHQLYSAVVPLLIDHLTAQRATSPLHSMLSHHDPLVRVRAFLALRTITGDASVPQNARHDMYSLVSTGDHMDDQLYADIIPLLIDDFAAQRDTSCLKSALSHKDPLTRIRAFLALRQLTGYASAPEKACEDVYRLLVRGDQLDPKLHSDVIPWLLETLSEPFFQGHKVYNNVIECNTELYQEWCFAFLSLELLSPTSVLEPLMNTLQMYRELGGEFTSELLKQPTGFLERLVDFGDRKIMLRCLASHNVLTRRCVLNYGKGSTPDIWKYAEVLQEPLSRIASKDSDRTCAILAALALGSIGKEQVGPVLVKCLGDGSLRTDYYTRIRNYCLRVLCALHEGIALPLFLQIAKDKVTYSRTGLFDNLRTSLVADRNYSHFAKQEMATILVELLRDCAIGDAEAIGDALVEIGDVSIGDSLLALIKSGTKVSVAFSTLGRLGLTAVLLDALRSTDPLRSAAAAGVLAKADLDQGSIEALRLLYTSEAPWFVRKNVIVALGRGKGVARMAALRDMVSGEEDLELTSLAESLLNESGLEEGSAMAMPSAVPYEPGVALDNAGKAAEAVQGSPRGVGRDSLDVGPGGRVTKEVKKIFIMSCSPHREDSKNHKEAATFGLRQLAAGDVEFARLWARAGQDRPRMEEGFQHMSRSHEPVDVLLKNFERWLEQKCESVLYGQRQERNTFYVEVEPHGGSSTSARHVLVYFECLGAGPSCQTEAEGGSRKYYSYGGVDTPNGPVAVIMTGGREDSIEEARRRGVVELVRDKLPGMPVVLLAVVEGLPIAREEDEVEFGTMSFIAAAIQSQSVPWTVGVVDWSGVL